MESTLKVLNALAEDVVKDSVALEYKDTKVKVVRLEYLLAIMLNTGRPKDKARIAQILDETGFDNGLLDKILKKHGLTKKWPAQSLKIAVSKRARGKSRRELEAASQDDMS